MFVVVSRWKSQNIIFIQQIYFVIVVVHSVHEQIIYLRVLA